MASHLTVTTSNAGVSNTRAFGSPTPETDGKDAFAALLGSTGADKPEAPAANAKPSNDNVTPSTDAKPGDDEKPDNPEAVAAVVDVQIAIVTPEIVKPELTALIDGLAALKAKLAAGEPLDPKALKELDTLLSDLAQRLGINLTDMPTADEMAALMAGTTSVDESLSSKLVEAFGPLAGELLAHTDPSASAELSEQLKAVGDKLAALLTALNQGETKPDALAELQDSIATDADLKAALANALKPTVVAADATPALATPELKLPVSALTTKTDTAATAAPDVQPTSDKAPDAAIEVKPVSTDADKPADSDTDQKSDDGKPADTKPADAKPNGVAAAANDKQPEPQSAAQPAQAARVDAVAAPRVVQTGYQTSQQQLNLPQLAFEMARQVSDGNTRFQIRLDPAELGKIDVRLDIDASGQVNARLTVEKAETLDLMQRDQRALERALQQAGLDSSKTNLEFSLKQNPFAGGQHGQNSDGRNTMFGNDLAEIDEVVPPTINLYRGNLSASGVNIIA